MPGSHGKRSEDDYSPPILTLFELLLLFCNNTEGGWPFPQHKVFLRQFSTGEEKLQKRQPIKSNDESERVVRLHLFGEDWLRSQWRHHIPARISDVCPGSGFQFCSKSTAATTPTQPSAPPWPPPSGSWSALWPRSWAPRRTCCWSAWARQEVGAARGGETALKRSAQAFTSKHAADLVRN